MNANSKIPEHWIERLLTKMLAIWGDGFTRKWSGVDIDDVKETWRHGLADMNEAALKRGMMALVHEKYPPDLPRFRELCHAQPVMYGTRQFDAITHEHRVTDIGEANLAKIRAMIAKYGLPKSEVPSSMTGIEWASKIIRDANETRGPIDMHRLKIAQDALRMWCASHHCTADALDEFGKWKLVARAEAHRRADEVQLPPLVASPHIYREPGDDDE